MSQNTVYYGVAVAEYSDLIITATTELFVRHRARELVDHNHVNYEAASFQGVAPSDDDAASDAANNEASGKDPSDAPVEDEQHKDWLGASRPLPFASGYRTPGSHRYHRRAPWRDPLPRSSSEGL